MSDIAVLINTAVAVLAAVLLIVRFRVNPVISLILASVYLGLAVGLGVEKTVKTITGGFGEIMVDVGLLIAFGVLMGSILNQSGAIRRLVEHLAQDLRPQAAPLHHGPGHRDACCSPSSWTSCWSSQRRLPASWRRKSASSARHGWPRPWPSPWNAASSSRFPASPHSRWPACSNVPLGKMLLFGLLLVIPTIIISIAIMTFLFRRGFWNEAKDEDHTFVAEEDSEGEEAANGGQAPVAPAANGRAGLHAASSAQPSGGTVAVVERERKEAPLILLFAPLLTSLLLIGAGAILEILEIELPWLQLLGEPVIALLIGLIGTCLVTRAAIGQKKVEEAIAVGFKESGQILILTGVGGSLAATVAAAGLGDILGGFFSASTVAPLLVVWAIAAVLHIAVGSVTLSAITAAGSAGTHRAGHRIGSGAAGPRRRCGIALHGSRHQQHVLAPAVTFGPECEGCTQIGHGGSVRSLRGGDPADPAHEPAVLTGPAHRLPTTHERRP